MFLNKLKILLQDFTFCKGNPRSKKKIAEMARNVEKIQKILFKMQILKVKKNS